MAEVFRFGDFQLDTGAFELRRGPVVVPVEPLVLDLLTLLLEHPGVVLSRDRLIASVWQGRIVSESTISTAVKSARKALGDTGRDQKYIRTIRGRGIQLVVPVTTVGTTAADIRLPVADVSMQPALYIRPFETMGDAGLEQPVPRPADPDRVDPGAHSSAAHRVCFSRGGPVDGSARIAVPIRDHPCPRGPPATIRDHADCRCGSDRNAERSPDLGSTVRDRAGAGEQEILLHKMIRRIEPRLMQAIAVELQTDGGEPGARAILMQAIVLLALKGWHRTTFVEATGMIEKAIVLEPDLALSHAYLALLIALGHRVGLLHDDDTTVPTVIAAVEKTLELENQDSTILGLVGCALADVGQVDRALPILQKAIEANPQNGHAKTALGAAFLVKRDYASAVRYLSDGIECSPADSRCAVWGAALAMAHLAQGESDEALEAAEKACKEDDRLYLPRLSLAAVHLVRKDQVNAVAAVQECVRTKPDLDRQEVIAVVGGRLGAGVWAIARMLMKNEISSP